MSNRSGHRGYVFSRPVFGSRTPQHVQNLVIRDHATRHGLRYKLSATEYAMPGCHMMLRQVLDELPELEGIIAYSLFMLPRRRAERLDVYHRVLTAGADLRFAVEGLVLDDETAVARLEDIWNVQATMIRMTEN